MADEKTAASAPPQPSYGATTQNPVPPYPVHDPAITTQPPYPPQQPAAHVPPPAGAPPPPNPYPYPQPGQEVPQAVYPTEPPPKYEGPTPVYPPQQGYPQPSTIVTPLVSPSATQSTTIVVTDISRFGPCARTVQCPNCQAVVTTSVSYQTGLLTWLVAGVICLFGCWAGCCLIPFCMPDCQDVHHHCPNCGRHLGAYHRL